MSKITIYHNPRCSKSRQSLQLLQEQGIEPTIVEYLQTPPSKSKLQALLTLLDMEPRELMRTNEAEYKENHLADTTLSKAQLIDAMIAHPKLIQRPIIVNGDKAVIGRPPENILEIL